MERCILQDGIESSGGTYLPGISTVVFHPWVPCNGYRAHRALCRVDLPHAGSSCVFPMNQGTHGNFDEDSYKKPGRELFNSQ